MLRQTLLEEILILQIAYNGCNNVTKCGRCYKSKREKPGFHQITNIIGKLKSVIDKTYYPEQIARAHVLLKEGYEKGNLIVSVNIINMNSVKNQVAEISIRNSAIIAGISLLLIAIIAPIANFAIIQKLIDYNDAVKTVGNIAASNGLFRIGIFLVLVVALLDIIVAWALYVFLVPINRQLSLLTAWLRLVYATILIAALIYLSNVIALLNGAEYLSGFSTAQLNSQVMIALNMFTRGWDFGLIVFGFHLLLLGYLMFKAGYMRQILGSLIILAGLGYLIDGFGKLLLTDYGLSVSMFTFIGEVILIFWLLIKGRKIEAKISN